MFFENTPSSEKKAWIVKTLSVFDVKSVRLICVLKSYIQLLIVDEER